MERIAASLEEAFPATPTSQLGTTSGSLLMPPASRGPKPRVGILERFDGDPCYCSAFLTSCSFLFSLQPWMRRFPLPSRISPGECDCGGSKSGCARSWLNFQRICNGALHRVRAGFLLGGGRGRAVGTSPGPARILACHSSWPQKSLSDLFLHGLANHIRDLLLAYPRSTSLDRAIRLAIKVGQRLLSRHSLAQCSPPLDPNCLPPS